MLVVCVYVQSQADIDVRHIKNHIWDHLIFIKKGDLFGQGYHACLTHVYDDTFTWVA